MTSTFTVMKLLVTFGLLSLTTARPTVGHQQDADKQDYTTFFPQEQNIRIPFVSSEEQADTAVYNDLVEFIRNLRYPVRDQGFTVRLPQLQSTREAEKQGRISFKWAQQQAPQYAKEESFIFTHPHWRTQIANKQQIKRNVPFTKKQGVTVNLPYAKEEGIRLNYPPNKLTSSVKEQGFTVRLPQLQRIGKQQGITFSYPQTQGFYTPLYGKQQGITFSYPQMQGLYTQSSNAKEQGYVPWSWRQQLNKLNAAMQGALCNITNDDRKLAEVAAFTQMDGDILGDFLKQLGNKVCDKDTKDAVNKDK